jgi:sarcinarray family protein
MRAVYATFIVLTVIVLFILVPGCAGAKNIIKAYFNGREATVTNVTLQVDEPFTIDLDVTPDRNTTVLAILLEPGGGDDSYRRISGDDKGIEVIKKGGPGSTVHFDWVLAPDGKWTDGNAPLDIQYDIWGETPNGDVQGYFTVVDAYILPRRYVSARQSADSPLFPLAALAAVVFIAAFIVCHKKLK